MIRLFMLNKVFGALAANVGTSSSDGGLSSIVVCSLTVAVEVASTFSCS